MWEIIPLYLGAWAGIPKEPKILRQTRYRERRAAKNRGWFRQTGLANRGPTTADRAFIEEHDPFCDL